MRRKIKRRGEEHIINVEWRTKAKREVREGI